MDGQSHYAKISINNEHKFLLLLGPHTGVHTFKIKYAKRTQRVTLVR